MNIHPRPDQERVIQEAIRSGLITNEIDVLDIGLESLQTKLVKMAGHPVHSLFDSEKHVDMSFNRTPQEAAAHICELRKGNHLPDGVTIRDLINEGRT